MSEQSNSPSGRAKLLRQEASGSRPDSKGVLARRWPYYTLFAVVGLIVIAYIDGGEEPLHPISQPVALPASGSSGEGMNL